MTATPNVQTTARVLLVDDNDAGRYSKSRVLRHAGYLVVEAVTGSQALRCVAEDNPDLILLDVRLPDISGLEVCRRIKADPHTSVIPVLQMSASFRDDRSKVAGLECGADGYITEPVEPSLLIATIEAFLRTRRAEQAVRESALEWQTTFDAITDGVALLDPTGTIVRSNHALGKLLHRPAGELIGMRLEHLLPPEDPDADLWASLKSGQRQRAERAKEGSVFALTVDPVADSGGQLRGAVAIVSDISERKLMDERLWHTQKLESIGVLAGGVAHDFNNLLMGIFGNASLGLEILDDREGIVRVLQDIMRAGERAADLTRQLLAYSGKGKFLVTAVDLSEIVSATLPLVKASFPRKVRLVLNLGRDLPSVEADKTQIEQIVMNLLINAAEAIGDNPGTVTVTTGSRHFEQDERPRYLADQEVRGDYVMLVVRDDGVGMDENTVARIFDPFFTTKFLGRGLGLSAVLGIMRSHRGALRVNSAPGAGTTFELLYPAGRAAPRVQRQEHPPFVLDAGQNHGKALVVDDEKVVRDFFKTALEWGGYEVIAVEDGAEALEAFSAAPDSFSLVLLDMVMPVMSGKDVLPRLLELRPETPVVVTSGQMEEEVRRELADRTIAGSVQKPCTMRVLLEKIRSFVAA